jgi:cell division protease FtsH
MSLKARSDHSNTFWHHRSGNYRSGPPSDPRPSPAPPPPPRWRAWLLPFGILITVLLLFRPSTTTPTNLNYSQFVHDVTVNKVSTATISSTGQVSGKLKGGDSYTSQIPTALSDDSLAGLLLDHKVSITGSQSSTTLLGVLVDLLPTIAFLGFFLWIGRRAQRQLAGGIGGIGRSRAKLYDQDRPSTRFADIAGYEGSKREVGEVIDFLKNPERYRRAGAVGPKGVLMVGPPGTGKTQMARAVAGEAQVPFFALSGASFVEMFVGVGASRVRDLFASARKAAPSIIFIDEIDAIGGRRGAGFATNDEREQTLNQMLAEMDGFDPTTGVVVIAATNRPETLDPALLRPGRFDRTVEVPLPNQRERAAILAVHARDKHLAPDVDFDVVSRATPGFSGADLANLINEAAINAVRDNREVVTAKDISDARDRLLIGRRDAPNALLPEEKNSVAIHEAGHALVAVYSEHADPVAKVTILPAGAALGVTEQLPESERHLYPLSYLLDSLTVRLGGRASELLVLGEASTGASSDLEGATDLALRMVREWGLSDALGPISYPGERRSGDPSFSRPFAEETQRLIDQEVTRLLREAEERAKRLLSDHRDGLERVVDLLLEKETIDGDELLRELGVPDGHHTNGTVVAPPLVHADGAMASGDGGAE